MPWPSAESPGRGAAAHMAHLRQLLLVAAAVTPAAAADPPPVIFWNSEASVPGSTVMAMGGGLANATLDLTDPSGAAVASPQVIGQWDGSIKFLLPEAGSTAAYRFRACGKCTTAHPFCCFCAASDRLLGGDSPRHSVGLQRVGKHTIQSPSHRDILYF